VGKLRCGFIGTGGIAEAHAKGYHMFTEDVEIVAAADIFIDNAKTFILSHGIEEAKSREWWYKDFNDLLKRDDIDLVSVCTPPYHHAEATVASLKAGKHVLCEKVMAGSLEECDAMIEAARMNNRILSVIFQFRFDQNVQKIRKLLDEKRLGKIFMGKADTHWYRNQEYYKVWWRGTWEKECGGATMQQATHLIDLLQWFMGPPDRLFGLMGTYTHGPIEVEDNSVAAVGFKDGSLGEITSSVSTTLQTTRLEIFGEHGSVQWSDGNLTVHLLDPSLQQETLNYLEQTVPKPIYEGHTAQVRDFLDSVTQTRRPYITGEDARGAVELIIGIYKSAFTRQVVKFPIGRDDPFYHKVSSIGPTRRET